MFDRQNYLSRHGDRQTVVKMDDEETEFVVDDVKQVVTDILETILGTNKYLPEKINQWSSTISEQCLGALSKMKKPFKYVVTCYLMQKSGAGVHTAVTYHWDQNTDNQVTVRWENSYITSVVSVFGLGL